MIQKIITGICLISLLAFNIGCEHDVNTGGNKVNIGNFTLRSPSDDIEINSYAPEFSWNAAENATSYRLTVATSRDYGPSDIVEQITTTGTSAQLSVQLDMQTTYHWYVTAMAANAAPRDCTRKYVFYTNPWTLDFNTFENTAAFNAYLAANGGSNTNAEIDAGLGISGRNTLKIDSNKTVELEKLWGNFTNYDTILIDYYASSAYNPILRLYTSKTGSGIYGCYDYNTSGGPNPAIPIAQGGGKIRLPVSAVYMSVIDKEGSLVSDADEAGKLVNPSNISTFSMKDSSGGCLYIKSISLINTTKMTAKIMNLTSIEEAAGIGSLFFEAAQGYRLVVQRSFITSSSLMNLGIAYYKEFAITGNDMPILMEIMAGVSALGGGKFIYTFYWPNGLVHTMGTLDVN